MKQLSLLLSLFTFLTAIPLEGQAPLGGRRIYTFLDLPASARITALGGNLITVKDDDHTLAFANPSLLNKEMHQQVAVNHSFHVADIQNGYVSYAHHSEPLNLTFHGGLQYISYGTFDAADEFGQVQGTFKAADYALTLGAGYQLYDKVSLGANLKIINSQLEAFDSWGTSLDLAAHYRDTSGRFTATLLIQNAGFQLSTYQEGNRELLPLNVQFGLSQRLKYLPFRLSVIFHSLQQWDLRYDDPDALQEDFIFGGEPQEESSFSQNVDNFFQHIIFNGEFLLGRNENFRLRLGYNHHRRQELSVSNFRSLAGFSGGVGFKVKRFRIDYGRGVYHLGGAVNHLTLSTNLGSFF